jgi:hypothetical protein
VKTYKYKRKVLNHKATYRHSCDYVEEAKIEIADKVFKQLNDVIFEMVCEEMSNKYVFQSSNYLTEAGYEMFEDQWFEFYHEHHGDILAQIQNKLIY